MLLVIALRDKIEERLKTADFLKNTDTANTYYQDAGRLQRISMVLSNTFPKNWLTLSSANNAALFLFLFLFFYHDCADYRWQFYS